MVDHRRVKNLIFFFFAVFLFSPAVIVLTAKESSSILPNRQKIFFPDTVQQLTVHYVSGLENGPTVLLFGGIHGDERAGYLAAERFIHLRIKNGNLIVVPRLNAVAIKKGKRHGLGGDMNRLFDAASNNPKPNPDAKVVELAKYLIRQADYVINLHQAYDFYAHEWISPQRNPYKWGQSNVIDTPTYMLRNGDKLEPGRFAQRVVQRSNTRISNRDYQFLVNNTDTSCQDSRHKEQRGSLTYYALTKEHKIAFAIEATKNCSLQRAVSFLTIAVNAALKEAGIRSDTYPSEDFLLIGREINDGAIQVKS